MIPSLQTNFWIKFLPFPQIPYMLLMLDWLICRFLLYISISFFCKLCLCQSVGTTPIRKVSLKFRYSSLAITELSSPISCGCNPSEPGDLFSFIFSFVLGFQSTKEVPSVKHHYYCQDFQICLSSVKSEEKMYFIHLLLPCHLWPASSAHVMGLSVLSQLFLLFIYFKKISGVFIPVTTNVFQ